MIRNAALALALFAPALAAAQEVDGVIVAGPSASTPAPMTTEQKIANILAGAKAADEADHATVEARKVHGEAGVAVGSGGYRSAYVTTVVPVGETGTVALHYSQSQGGRGFGYGHGPGPGRFDDRRTGEQRNLGLAMQFDASRDKAPDGCAAAFRDGRQPVEPLWATQMRRRSACDPVRAD